MIPKIIHYCWFGKGDLPDEALKCIQSWKDYFPDYEIKRWDESNFDVNISKYTEEAYKNKKWAFVSDYARFYILYKYGGIYFDTDVEVIKNFDRILEKGSFMGCEKEKEEFYIAPGLGMASEPGNIIYKEILEFYEKDKFIDDNNNLNYETVVNKVTKIFREKGFLGTGNIEKIYDIYIYPPEFFCPKNYYTGELKITDNTYSIHHYSATWYEKEELIILKFKQKSKKIFGDKIGYIVSLPIHYILRFLLRVRKKGLLETTKFLVKNKK